MFLDMPTEESTSLLGGFPANLSALPVPAKAKKTKGGSGRNSTALLKKPDPVGALLRMCLVSGLGMQTMSWATWKNPGTPAGRWWWVLGLPAHPINGSAYGWLPTLKASDGRVKGNGGSRNSPGLDQMARTGWLPTVVANDDNKSPEAHMAMKRRMKGGPRNTITSLQVQAKAGMLFGGGKGPLSPCFCEWMMGYPEGWTDVDDTDGNA